MHLCEIYGIFLYLKINKNNRKKQVPGEYVRLRHTH